MEGPGIRRETGTEGRDWLLCKVLEESWLASHLARNLISAGACFLGAPIDEGQREPGALRVHEDQDSECEEGLSSAVGGKDCPFSNRFRAGTGREDYSGISQTDLLDRCSTCKTLPCTRWKRAMTIRTSDQGLAATRRTGR